VHYQLCYSPIDLVSGPLRDKSELNALRYTPTAHYSPIPTHQLSRFRVFGVLAAARAVLLEPQAILHVFLVLARLVIALFAIATRHRQNGLIFVRHINLDNLIQLCVSLLAESSKAADGI
jgi:hypothetical protein